MKNKSGKQSNISVRFGITVGIEIVAMLLVLVLLCVQKTYVANKNTFIASMETIAKSFATNLNQRNSKFMQQLRLYTMSDIVRADDYDIPSIVSWLREHKAIRSGDFVSVIFCDYEDGMAYGDDGSVFDASQTEFFKRMKEGSLSQYVSNPMGTSPENTVYWVCKQITREKKSVGFFAASISHETLAKAVNGKSIDGEGFAMLLSEYGVVVCHPQTELLMKENFLNADQKGFMGVSAAARKMIAGESGFAWVEANGGKDLLVYAPVSGTAWSLGFSIPDKAVYRSAQEIGNFMIGAALLITFILVITVFLGIRRTLKPLKHLERNIHEIASGSADLTVRIAVRSQDEIGSVTSGFNSFVEKLQTIMQGIKHSRKTLGESELDLGAGLSETSASISEIVESINSVTAQISSQSQFVNETASAVNEIASNIDSLEKMITKQADGVSEASSAVEEMIGNINAVNNSVERMSDSFDTLESLAASGNEKQNEMHTKIALIESQSEMLLEANKVIASIASQTNLLAMNAAIEAAHAGGAGAGFAVVSDEIRKLSENSASQSRTIGEQLKNISNSIGTVVKTSDETSKMFASVAAKIRETDEIVKQIKSAMEEQRTGSVQINQALHSMSDSTAEVKRASKEMSVGNAAILSDVKRLQDATSDMNSSVQTMSACTNRMTETGNSLNNIVSSMKSSIEEIGSQIDNFEV